MSVVQISHIKISIKSFLNKIVAQDAVKRSGSRTNLESSTKTTCLFLSIDIYRHAMCIYYHFYVGTKFMKMLYCTHVFPELSLYILILVEKHILFPCKETIKISD